MTMGFSASFQIDDFTRHCLLEGLDDIGLTLKHEARNHSLRSAASGFAEDRVGRAPHRTPELNRRPGRRPRQFQLGRVLLRILQEQSDLVIQICSITGPRVALFLTTLCTSRTPARAAAPHLGRGLGIGRQDHQPLRNFGLHHARKVPFRRCFGSSGKCGRSPAQKPRSPATGTVLSCPRDHRQPLHASRDRATLRRQSPPRRALHPAG